MDYSTFKCKSFEVLVYYPRRFIEPFNFNFHKAMRMWKKEEMRGIYKVKLTVAGQEFFGTADLPQQAKHSAAEQVLDGAN